MDRNVFLTLTVRNVPMSLSARRAWIEILTPARISSRLLVALRKESVDRNLNMWSRIQIFLVALRKESVDRNVPAGRYALLVNVALRKESVDRNRPCDYTSPLICRRSPQGERG